MYSATKINEITLARIADVAPVIRGALARPFDTDGRPNRVVLAYTEKARDGAVSLELNDLDNLKNVLADGTRRIFVAGIGEFSVGATFDQAKVVRAGNAAVAAKISGDMVGQIAIVTGGAGGLGFSIAQELRAQGAEVALLDIAQGAVQAAAEKLEGLGLACDVTDPAAIESAINKVVVHYGGIDVLISNAGAAHQGSLLELEDEHFQKAFALNFWSHHFVARDVVKVMKKQGTGGALVFNVSKQAVNPGPNFGAYGTPKAALMALMRQYAVEHGPDGITSNAVNADRIRTGLMTDKMVEERSKARGLTPEQYMCGNLVKREVTGKDVAGAFVHLAKARVSTGAVLTVDGGNVAAMMR